MIAVTGSRSARCGCLLPVIVGVSWPDARSRRVADQAPRRSRRGWPPPAAPDATFVTSTGCSAAARPPWRRRTGRRPPLAPALVCSRSTLSWSRCVKSGRRDPRQGLALLAEQPACRADRARIWIGAPSCSRCCPGLRVRRAAVLAQLLAIGSPEGRGGGSARPRRALVLTFEVRSRWRSDSRAALTPPFVPAARGVRARWSPRDRGAEDDVDLDGHVARSE